MIHIIGEILVDKFISQEKEEKFPGGAPFNVATNIVHFGGNVSFLGSVGNDDDGKFLKQYVKNKKIQNFNISTLKNRRTTIAEVSIKDGERSFRFIRDNGADYAISLSKVKKIDIEKNDIVHIGSLMLSTPRGRRLFKKIVAISLSKSAYISFDVNYRDDIFESTTVAKRIFKNAIKNCDYIKFSEEELFTLTGKKRITTALNHLLNKDQTAFVSLGKDGSLIYKNNKIIKVPTQFIKPIDTTGAGDAFYSYILFSLDSKNFNHREVLEKANFVGACATQKKGAIDVVPSIKEINKRTNI